ncbi:PA3496 family putative envelope integrity protein [Vibrio harveyi]|uniref:PA3496 family putative envelope integrity protein n=1 Tax=Vibrio harveyi TaxID=669 RepID=UPI00237E6670|nr:hypothetical protein [Vibrio harveyi]HDM8061681.1 hypothetical protein [Vibrio harveyi]
MKSDWDNFIPAKSTSDWSKKPAAADRRKVDTRRRIEEIQEQKRLKDEFEL